MRVDSPASAPAPRASERMMRAGAVRRARTRAAILDALEALLRERSFEAISVYEVAERASVSIGSVYGHFGNKTRVVLALALERIEPEVGRIERQLRAQTPLERALELGDLLARAADLTPAAVHLVCHPRSAYQELIDANDPARPVAERVLGLFARFERDLEVAERCGLLAEGVTASTLRGGLLATWLGLLQAATPGAVVEPLADPVAEVWGAVRRALAVRSD